VLEEPVELGQKYQVEMGTEAESREVRIVWAQDEADGQIVGVQFLDVVDGTVPPPPKASGSSAPPGSRTTAPPGTRPPRTDPRRAKADSVADEKTTDRASTLPPPKNRS
jgi:hypothetical protein